MLNYASNLSREKKLHLIRVVSDCPTWKFRPNQPMTYHSSFVPFQHSGYSAHFMTWVLKSKEASRRCNNGVSRLEFKSFLLLCWCWPDQRIYLFVGIIMCVRARPSTKKFILILLLKWFCENLQFAFYRENGRGGETQWQNWKCKKTRYKIHT
jgi:hypothetical protein